MMISTVVGGTLELAYGDEPWTTATHLARAAERLAAVPGSDDAQPGSGAVPLLWVETGLPCLPTARRLGQSTSAGWLIDTHRGLGWRRRLAAAFDVVFVAQADAVEPLAAAGLDVRWLPLAAPADLVSGASVTPLAQRQYDVAFVGQAPRGSLRAAVLDALAERFSVAPRPSYMAPPEMMQLYSSARVVVNLPLAHDLNMRVFEAAAAGAMLVTGPAIRLDHVLPEGSYELVTERTIEDWVQGVERALADPDAQHRATATQERVMAEHTYDHRLATVLDALGSSARRPLSDDERSTALGAAYARWGQIGAVAHLSTPLPARVRLVGEAASWRMATAGVRSLRRIRRQSAGLHPGRSLRAS